MVVFIPDMDSRPRGEFAFILSIEWCRGNQRITASWASIPYGVIKEYNSADKKSGIRALWAQ
jgi:hypothetical protein